MGRFYIWFEKYDFIIELLSFATGTPKPVFSWGSFVTLFRGRSIFIGTCFHSGGGPTFFATFRLHVRF
jgi:hypothetical protein